MRRKNNRLSEKEEEYIRDRFDSLADLIIESQAIIKSLGAGYAELPFVESSADVRMSAEKFIELYRELGPMVDTLYNYSIRLSALANHIDYRLAFYDGDERFRIK
jgi:hypothetical protein